MNFCLGFLGEFRGDFLIRVIDCMGGVWEGYLRNIFKKFSEECFLKCSVDSRRWSYVVLFFSVKRDDRILEE